MCLAFKDMSLFSNAFIDYAFIVNILYRLCVFHETLETHATVHRATVSLNQRLSIHVVRVQLVILNGVTNKQ